MCSSYVLLAARLGGSGVAGRGGAARGCPFRKCRGEEGAPRYTCRSTSPLLPEQTTQHSSMCLSACTLHPPTVQSPPPPRWVQQQQQLRGPIGPGRRSWPPSSSSCTCTLAAHTPSTGRRTSVRGWATRQGGVVVATNLIGRNPVAKNKLYKNPTLSN